MTYRERGRERDREIEISRDIYRLGRNEQAAWFVYLKDRLFQIEPLLFRKISAMPSLSSNDEITLSVEKMKNAK